jgi:hypothetical protein
MEHRQHRKAADAQSASTRQSGILTVMCCLDGSLFKLDSLVDINVEKNRASRTSDLGQ